MTVSIEMRCLAIRRTGNGIRQHGGQSKRYDNYQSYCVITSSSINGRQQGSPEISTR